MTRKVRTASCWKCDITWEHPLEFSPNTTNLSGEKTAWCPRCGKKADMYSEVFDVGETDAEKALLEGPWTQFMDMHSGGGLKEKPYHYIYIQAPEKEAKSVFYARFGHNPHRVTCTCCGEDYSISSEDGDDALLQVTGYERKCEYVQYRNSETGEKYGRYIELGRRPYGSPWDPPVKHTPLEEYMKQPDVLFILAGDIKPEERTVDVPEQGYLWRD